VCYVAWGQQRGVLATSEEMSFHLLMQASNVRRLALILSEKEIIKPIEGAKGGYVLARKAECTSLTAIYAAVEDLNPDFMGLKKMIDKAKKCTTLVKDTQIVLNNQLRRVEAEMIQTLGLVFISDVQEASLKQIEENF